MVPYQRTPRQVARAIRYSGLWGPWTVGPVGDFLEKIVATYGRNTPIFLGSNLYTNIGYGTS